MAKYDGLIIPRSYNDYINKSSPIDVSRALQLSGVMDNAPAAQSTKPAKSGGIFAANAVIMANNKTLSGVAISAGSVVRVLFTAALTGSDATTGLTLTYNGNTYAVKVGKNGALAAFVASEISSGVFKYLQAYTTLELAFDGSQFVVMGNPVVISNADFSIMADGSITYKNCVRSNTIYQYLEPQGAGTTSFDVSSFDWTMNEAFHFKISLMTNFFLYAEAEGSFGINNGTGRLMINYKSDKITSIILDDTTKKITVQTNDNIWGATLVFGVPTNWVVCP